MAKTSRTLLDYLKRHLPGLGRMLGLVAVLTLFTLLDKENSFLTLPNLSTVLTQSTIVAVAAIGMTLVIISGGIDLSTGSIIALSSVVAALALKSENAFIAMPATAACLAILAGGVCGALNGLAVTGLKIVPFIATLGMMSIARGVALYLSDGQAVRPESSWLEDLMEGVPFEEDFWLWQPIFAINNLLLGGINKVRELMGSEQLADYEVSLAPGVWVFALLAVAFIIILRRTVFGRHVYVVGSNEATARLCGLPVARLKIAIYTLAGVFAGFAGLLQFSRLTQGDPTVAVGLELDVIAAVVIGGGSLNGGEGSIGGTIVGALIIHLLRNGCNIIGVDNFIQQIIIGVIIIGAVCLDQLRQRFVTQ